VGEAPIFSPFALEFLFSGLALEGETLKKERAKKKRARQPATSRNEGRRSHALERKKAKERKIGRKRRGSGDDFAPCVRERGEIYS